MALFTECLKIRKLVFSPPAASGILWWTSKAYSPHLHRNYPFPRLEGERPASVSDSISGGVCSTYAPQTSIASARLHRVQFRQSRRNHKRRKRINSPSLFPLSSAGFPEPSLRIREFLIADVISKFSTMKRFRERTRFCKAARHGYRQRGNSLPFHARPSASGD